MPPPRRSQWQVALLESHWRKARGCLGSLEASEQLQPARVAIASLTCLPQSALLETGVVFLESFKGDYLVSFLQ